ncbi:MAG: hypothetical protein ACYC99_09040 [Candidatus Geothermincolia bacterium]
MRRKVFFRAGVVVLCAGLFALAMMVPQPGGNKGRAKSSFGLDSAIAGEFINGDSVAGRQLLGLFSEDVPVSMGTKIPASERPAIRNVRIFCKWKTIETSHKGEFSWTAMDTQINSALGLGVNSILLTITGPVPSWAVNKSNPNPNYMGPPKRVQDWGDFCGAVAARYRDYVDFYQIWQEPGWDSSSPPAQQGTIYYSGDCDYTYLGMLRSAYPAIKKWAPNSMVIAGGMLNGLTRSDGDFEHYRTLLAGANQDVSMKITAPRNIVAERPIYFNYHGWCKDGSVELGVKAPDKVWYLAEGATHPGFEEWICIQNPGATAANVNITYMFPGGGTQPQNLQVAPFSRSTIDVNAAVGPNKDVSAKVTSNQPIVAERPMYFNYHSGWDGGSISSGVASLSKTWYLAEGATQPGFEEWISLMNPGTLATDVTITYMFPGGATQVQKVHMAPTSRETVLVNNVVGPNKDVSAKVEATEPIIAERPMYFLYHGAWSGGDSQVGATAPANSWFLAEGTTRSNQYDGAFEEWISIQNPGNTAATVNFKYMFPGGATQAAAKSIAAHSRETVLVNGVVGPDKDVSVQLTSDTPIVVERPMYFNYHNGITGGDVELGCTAASGTWYFAEGTTRSGFEEWTTLQNPNAEDTTATVTYMFSDGTTQVQQVGLPGNSRTTVGVNRALSMANVCDALAVHPYDWPAYWSWYYQYVRNIQASMGFADRELTVTEIGWPHAGRDEFSAEGQRQAIGDQGVGSLWGTGCRKIWVFEDVDPPSSWDQAYNGLFDVNGNAMPAWNEYKRWQGILQNYGNKPNHLW